MAEHLIVVQDVVGSSPTRRPKRERTTKFLVVLFLFYLAGFPIPDIIYSNAHYDEEGVPP